MEKAPSLSQSCLELGTEALWPPRKLLPPRRRAQRGLRALQDQRAEPTERAERPEPREQPADAELHGELGEEDAGAAGEATVELRGAALLRAHERELWQARERLKEDVYCQNRRVSRSI